MQVGDGARVMDSFTGATSFRISEIPVRPVRDVMLTGHDTSGTGLLTLLRDTIIVTEYPGSQ